MATKDTLSLDDIDSLLSKSGMGLGDPNQAAQRPSIFYGTGIRAIDFALGGGTGELGGLPAGHVTEIYGSEAVGKTSLVYRMIAEAQKNHPDKINLLFDYEHTTDKNYIRACGVDMDRVDTSAPARKDGTQPKLFRIFKPRTLEEGFAILLLFHKTGRLGIAAFDSLAAMMPKQDVKKRQDSLEDNARVASKASVMSDLLRHVCAEIADSNTAVAFINHEIANIQQNPFGGYVPPKITPGGKALKYWAVLRLELLFRGTVTDDKKKTYDGEAYKGSIGKKIELIVEKNKLGNPGSRVQYQILAGEGLDRVSPLIRSALKQGLIRQEKKTYHIEVPGFDPIKVVGEKALRDAIRLDEPRLTAMTQLLLVQGESNEDEEDTSLNSLLPIEEIEL